MRRTLRRSCRLGLHQPDQLLDQMTQSLGLLQRQLQSFAIGDLQLARAFDQFPQGQLDERAR